MTTINTNSTTSIGSGSSGGGSTSQIASLNKQITQLQNQLKSLGTDDTLTTEQKSEQQQLIETQIQLIEAQIAQIEQQQAEKAQEQQSNNKAETAVTAKSGDGVNRPTASNALDVYI
ncbi:FlxA-like family protein [Erwinia sp. MMLR14_017]|uniref:FlxA-like family protein n=1 Tax=Erwinia sp. MMLR14_017 TaxID=3093842 RepID=UPI00298F5571|nr:FlxA-like family protein [Erwinia sp. MMLR14_017]MDW8847178.1 FlxA-like family protein [Erwinia sp. MMLR14_017]